MTHYYEFLYVIKSSGDYPDSFIRRYATSELSPTEFANMIMQTVFRCEDCEVTEITQTEYDREIMRQKVAAHLRKTRLNP